MDPGVDLTETPLAGGRKGNQSQKSKSPSLTQLGSEPWGSNPVFCTKIPEKVLCLSVDKDFL